MDGAPGGDAEGVPRWVKGLVVLGLAVALLVLALHLTGSVPGGHGP